MDPIVSPTSISSISSSSSSNSIFLKWTTKDHEQWMSFALQEVSNNRKSNNNDIKFDLWLYVWYSIIRYVYFIYSINYLGEISIK